ncbi:TPA: glycosyltransferase family 4 protein [Klebsiella pneumoniae]|nr:glycosyltransferase family 4 protein [Klebsiella pneumoniae]
MENIFYLVSRLPIGYSGREYILKQNIKIMQDNGYNVTLAYFDDGQIKEDLIKQDPLLSKVKLYPLKKVGALSFFYNLLFKRKLAIQECLFYSKKQSDRIQNKLLTDGFNILLVDMVRMAHLVEEIKFPVKLLEYDDLLSTRYKRMRDVQSDSFNLLGTYASKYPVFFSKIAVYLKDFLLMYEEKKIYKRENSLANKFNRFSFTSKLEANDFKKRINYSGKVYDNPPCLSTTEDHNYKHEKIDDFIFVGNLKSNHNLSCLKNLVRIFSNDEIKNVNINVYGDYDQRAEIICNGVNNITLCGRVVDLHEKLYQAKCLVAPFSFGTGIKIKIIEAMQCKTLVMTNSIGAEGIPMTAGKDYLLCENDDDFIRNILMINNVNYNDKKMNDIILSAYEIISKNYSDIVVSNNFIEFLRGPNE